VRVLLVGIVVAAALFAAPLADAKFRSGDLRVCNASHCVAIVDPDVIPRLGYFYYATSQLVRMRRPALGTRYYELRFRNGYVTGIVAGQRLGRFLSYGVNLDRFERGRWYAVPRRVSAELRRLTVGMRPYHLTRTALARAR
jgi:hypothetical protein